MKSPASSTPSAGSLFRIPKYKMRIWAKTTIRQTIVNQTVREFGSLRSFSYEELTAILHELCQDLDLARPVLLDKHVREFSRFQRLTFKAADFMDSIPFDTFEIEVLKEKKKEYMI